MVPPRPRLASASRSLPRRGSGDAHGHPARRRGARSASSARWTRRAWCRRRASSRAATSSSVLALPGFARARRDARAQPSVGLLEPSDADLRRRGARCTTTASASASSTTTRRRCTWSSRCRARARTMRLDPDGGRRGPRARRRRSRAVHARIRGPPEPARDGRRDRAALQRGRRRAARGGHRRRQVARLPRAGAALGRGERRAHGRVDEHDQPAGAARRQGPAVPRAGAHRPDGALRAAEGVAQLPVPAAARAGAAAPARAVRGRDGERARRRSRRGRERTKDGSLADLPTPPRARGVGRGVGGARPLHADEVPALREVLPVQGAARGGAGGRDRRQPPPAALRRRGAPRRRRTGTTPRCCRRTRGSSSTRGTTSRTRPRRTSAARSRGARSRACSTGSTAAGRGCCRALVEQLSASKDLLSAASLDLVEDAARAGGARGAREEQRCCSTCSTRSSQESGQPVVRLTDDFATHPIWKAGLARALEDMLGEIELLQDGLRSCASASRASAKLDEALAPLLNELRAVTRAAAGGGRCAAPRARAAAGRRQTVRWMEVTRQASARSSLSAVPLDLAPILREDLFKRLDSAIVTSATLTPTARRRRGASTSSRRGSGSTIRSSSRRPAIFPSPFDYREQALLACRRDMPAPNVDADGHRRARDAHRCSTSPRRRTAGCSCCSRAIATCGSWRPSCARAASTGAGRCSCTARRRATRCSRASATRARRCCSARRRSGKGVDVPGDALRGLRHREAAVPRADRAGDRRAVRGDRGARRRRVRRVHAAARVAAPEAGLRPADPHGTDRGVVVIADPRIVTKRYGRDLLEALPPARSEADRPRGAQLRRSEVTGSSIGPPAFTFHPIRLDLAPIQDRLRRPQLRRPRARSSATRCRREPLLFLKPPSSRHRCRGNPSGCRRCPSRSSSRERSGS